MKKFFLMCMMLSVLACVKVQKKTDLENSEAQRAPVAVEEAEEIPPAPVVYVLDEVKSLTEDTLIVADQVYLKSNARIYTNQFSLEIKATSIFIERGVFIQTFAESNQVAPMETLGIDGGVVHIVGNDIHGNLQVFMNGQSGGPGYGGWVAVEGSNFYPAQDACNPKSGKNSGGSGSFFLEVNQSQDFSVTTSMKIAEGGAIGPVLQSLFFNATQSAQTYNNFNRINCLAVPVIGKAGIPGQICLKLSEADRPVCENFKN